MMMKKFQLPILFLLTLLISNHTVKAQETNEIQGRWDLTVNMDGQEVPSWLEVKLSGIRTLVGYFVAHNGSARPISRVNYQDGEISFSIPPQWDDSDRDMVFEGKLDGGQLSGTITSSMGKKHSFTGEKAPLMIRENAPKWGKTIELFNGKNLDGWHADKSQNQWEVINGILTSKEAGANLISDQEFEDFKLHVEFRYPEGSNSGVYLRGRYEVQIEDNKGTPPSSIYFGGVYGFLTPNEMVVKSPGVWQTFDITLIGRRVTIVANGKEIICDQIIPGITGGALDSDEGQPGPLMLQGDHGAIEFRKIEITPAK
ncbi:3-keto-disaccharide hydrolase [Cyclobacterium plantarum]|uniref:3-keto-disaccharide hydrolase n=1 Tax=Cyclobacterium plantarum TaxID=2716263 RepID=UPI003F6E5F49